MNAEISCMSRFTLLLAGTLTLACTPMLSAQQLTATITTGKVSGICISGNVGTINTAKVSIFFYVNGDKKGKSTSLDVDKDGNFGGADYNTGHKAGTQLIVIIQATDGSALWEKAGSAVSK